MEGESIQVDRFASLQRLRLDEANQIVAERLAKGNVTYALDGLEFAVPIREIVIQGQVQLHVLLRGRMEPGDTLSRVKIAPRAIVEEIQRDKVIAH